MTLKSIKRWHEIARQNPTYKDFNVQLGCHLEEVLEMLNTLVLSDTTHTVLGDPSLDLQLVRVHLTALSHGLKSGYIETDAYDPVALLDALCDQVVTAAGVAHCAGANFEEGLSRVSVSNWSKTENGTFVRDENGKIKKGRHYQPPVLDDLV